MRKPIKLNSITQSVSDLKLSLAISIIFRFEIPLNYIPNSVTSGFLGVDRVRSLIPNVPSWMGREGQSLESLGLSSLRGVTDVWYMSLMILWCISAYCCTWSHEWKLLLYALLQFTVISCLRDWIGPGKTWNTLSPHNWLRCFARGSRAHVCLHRLKVCTGASEDLSEAINWHILLVRVKQLLLGCRLWDAGKGGKI